MNPAARRSRAKSGKGALVVIPVVASAAALLVAGCSSSSSSSAPSGSSSSSGSSPSSSSGSGASASISATNLTNDFSAMAGLKDIASKGKGSVAVILPDTTSSARYTEFDAPYLTKALQTAGLDSSQFSVQNAQGSDTTEFTDAQEAITKGATVLIMDPLDSGVGAQIENYAKSHGVDVVDYDRITSSGSRQYYVSFDNVKVGTLIGDGFVSCSSDWGVKKPEVLVMKGAPTDNNATLFAQGYDAVLKPHFDDGSFVLVGTPAGTWDPPTAESEFQQQFTAHKNINSAVVPNDENAAPIITYLQRQGIKAKTFPVTGQDATLVGLQNILSGYQCGTVYKPIYQEAQAAAALALFLRASQTPPSSLVNGTTKDPGNGTEVPSVLLTPEWVTTKNMNDTVIADKFVEASQLCTSQYADDCKSAGISG
ncbi:MAG TPA: substrate-binding domain-containing protein [Streptosporangiaceae bacterium]